MHYESILKRLPIQVKVGIKASISAIFIVALAFSTSMPSQAFADKSYTVSSTNSEAGSPFAESEALGDELGVGFAEAQAIDVSFEDLNISVNSEYSTQSLAPKNFQALMAYAEQYKGWAYKWGGKYPSQGGFDCSGLVTWCYDNALGATIDGWYTNAEKIYTAYCDFVPANEARPGDIVFWRGTYGSDVNYISHVGIYCGENLCYAAGNPIGYYDITKIKNINGELAEYFFGSLREIDDGDVSTDDGILMYRMYNPNSGEHFYTASLPERSMLIGEGWGYEGVGWVAPYDGNDVYRLYSGTDHHYTTNVVERDWLLSLGWEDEGVGWHSGGDVALYRQFNPNVDPLASYNNSGSHNYTTSSEENDWLVTQGWQAEGVGWYALS